MAVRLDALPREVQVEPQLHRLLQHVVVDRDAVVAHDDALGSRQLRRQRPPLVLPDVLNSEPLGGVHRQDLGKHVPGVFGEGLGHLVLAG